MQVVCVEKVICLHGSNSGQVVAAEVVPGFWNSWKRDRDYGCFPRYEIWMRKRADRGFKRYKWLRLRGEPSLS